jgi:hypothetical protein
MLSYKKYPPNTRVYKQKKSIHHPLGVLCGENTIRSLWRRKRYASRSTTLIYNPGNQQETLKQIGQENQTIIAP